MLFLRVIAWYGAEKFSLKKVVSIFTSGGSMSLVGTRPILQDELRQYELHHRARIAIKPGITGMWQVSGRSDITDFEEVVRLDTEYISNETVNAGTGKELTIKELTELVAKVVGYNGEIKWDPDKMKIKKEWLLPEHPAQL